MAAPTVEEFAQEYSSSLADLTFNSKPLINMLTTVAEENVDKAKVVVNAIEAHLAKVSADIKLPILYLIDCIVKNVGQDYTSLFSKNIVGTFCNVFKVVDEKTRAEMFKLRQTWNDVFPQTKLYAIDVQIRLLDPAWPVTAQPTSSIHLNPKFLARNNTIKPTTAKPKAVTETVMSTLPKTTPAADIDKETLKMQEELIKKQKELLELQRKTLELEVLQTQVKLQEQMKSGGAPVSKNILMKPEVAKNLLPEVMSKRPLGIAASAQNQRVPPPVKINPVNPTLAQAKPPIRDPRLRRQDPRELNDPRLRRQQDREPEKSSSDPRLKRHHDNAHERFRRTNDAHDNVDPRLRRQQDTQNQQFNDPRLKGQQQDSERIRRQPEIPERPDPRLRQQPETNPSDVPKQPPKNFQGKSHEKSKKNARDPRLSRKPEKPPKAPKISSMKISPIVSQPTDSPKSSTNSPKSSINSPKSSINSPKSSTNSLVVDMEVENNEVPSPKLSSVSGSSLSLSSLGSISGSSLNLSSLGGSSPHLGLSSSTTSLISSPSKSDKIDKSKTPSNLVTKEQPKSNLVKKESPKNDNISNNGNSPNSNDTLFKRKPKKNRNYMRHRSPSPDEFVPQDEDLRALPRPDKQARIEVEEKNNAPEPVLPVEPITKHMDIDLRQLPPAGISKKRTSTEGSDQASKKSKTMDILFGNEDVDLRQLAIPPVLPAPTAPEMRTHSAEPRVKTPPPPVISTEKEKKAPQQQPAKDTKKSDFDAIRAKLAIATNRDKVLSKSYNKKKIQAAQDLDLRVNAPVLPVVDPAVFISPEDAKSIQSGTMTKEQQQQLMSKIFMQIEKNKLMEAKKKDHEDSLNQSLQPISDDEFELEEPPAEKPIEGPLFQRRNPKKQEDISSPNIDKDERIVPLPVAQIQKVIEEPLSGSSSPQAQFHGNNSPQAQFHGNNSPQAQFHGNNSPQAQFLDKDERINIPPPPLPPLRPPLPEHLPLSNFAPRNMPPQQHIDQNAPPPQFFPRGGDIRQRPPFIRGMPPNQWRGRGRGMQPMPPQRPSRPWMQNQQQHGPHWRQQGPRREFPPHLHPQQMPQFEEEFQKEEEMVVSILEDIKTINIDNIPREIRTYGDIAIIFMNWDDPREISFQSGSRRVVFNNREGYILNFGDVYKECLVNNFPFLVKLGVPTREIFINEVGYECFFGGAPLTVTTENNMTLTVQMDGPNPHVKISDEKRTDLVVGKVNLILNAKSVVPVFLDAKIQRIVIDGESVSLKFVDALKTCLINDVPFKVEFGGLPKPFFIHGRKHFIRFSVLPKGVRPGQVRIRDMEGEIPMSPKQIEQDMPELEPFTSADSNGPLTGQESPDNRSKSPSFFQNLMMPSLNTFDVISNALATPTTPSAGNYEVISPKPTVNSSEPTNAVAAPPLSTTVNINDLFQRLVASGFVKPAPVEETQPPLIDTKPIVETKTQQVPALEDHPVQIDPNINDNKPDPNINYSRNDPNIDFNRHDEPKKKPEVVNNKGHNTFIGLSNEGAKYHFNKLRSVNFNRPETLRVRQHGLYLSLYSGLQCSSCGMRFAPEASQLYSQHLDWHFRQNRKGKNKVRVAQSRRWYYSLADWKNYEEIEDLAEREKNYFDQQQQASELQAEDGDEETEIPSVPADTSSTSERCEVCKDAFDQFFNEEKEEWHLKNAIRVDEKNYHPVCYDDFQKSILETSVEETKTAPENKLIPGLEIILDDDEDEEYEPQSPAEVVSLPSESEDTSIVEDVQVDNKEELPDEPVDDGDDDDVILNEVAPIKIVVDDESDEDDDNFSKDPNVENFEKVKRSLRYKVAVEDDGFMEVGEVVSLKKGEHIKIKSEPTDDKDLIPQLAPPPLEPSQDYEAPLDVEEAENNGNLSDDNQAAHMEIITSIDGNIELTHNAPVSVPTSVGISNRIKINISKPLPVINQKQETNTDDSVSVENISLETSDFAHEEPEITHLKPALQGVHLKKLPPVNKGAELTGLCSIM